MSRAEGLVEHQSGGQRTIILVTNFYARNARRFAGLVGKVKNGNVVVSVAQARHGGPPWFGLPVLRPRWLSSDADIILSWPGLQWRNHHLAETAACPSFLGAFYVLVVIKCELAGWLTERGTAN